MFNHTIFILIIVIFMNIGSLNFNQYLDWIKFVVEFLASTILIYSKRMPLILKCSSNVLLLFNDTTQNNLI